MGGPWTINTGNKFIRAHWWGHAVAVAYGAAGWPSQAYQLFVWEQEP